MKVSKSNTFIVIAAFNEAKRIRKTLRDLKKEGYKNIVVVDDGSRDKTYSTALSEGVWVLQHKVNLGQGAALQTGIQFALKKGAEAVVTFDADGQHDAKDIEKMINKLNEGYDIVLGSRFLKENKIPLSRRIILKGGVAVTRFISSINVTDTHNGLRVLSKKAAEKIKITINGMTHASEILDKIHEQRLKYTEVPVTIKYSEETLRKGQSSLNSVKILLKMIIKKIMGD